MREGAPWSGGLPAEGHSRGGDHQGELQQEGLHDHREELHLVLEREGMYHEDVDRWQRRLVVCGWPPRALGR